MKLTALMLTGRSETPESRWISYISIYTKPGKMSSGCLRARGVVKARRRHEGGTQKVLFLDGGAGDTWSHLVATHQA